MKKQYTESFNTKHNLYVLFVLGLSEGSLNFRRSYASLRTLKFVPDRGASRIFS